MNADLDIVPAINKIDLPSAHPEEVKVEIEDELAIPADDAVCVSGKTGEGIHDLLEAIVFRVSPPTGDANKPLKALILDSYFDEYRGVVATVRIFDGQHDLLEAIVFRVSPPTGDANKPLKALILDSYFDEYRGVVATVRIFDGQVKKGDHLRMMQGGEEFLVDGVGVRRPAEFALDALGVGEVGFVVTGVATVRIFDGQVKKGDHLRMMQGGEEFLVDGVGERRPAEFALDALGVGEVGFVVTGLKDPEAVHVGDTLTLAGNPCDAPLEGYREAKPMVYTGLFPIDNKHYENLRDAHEKLHVNDPSSSSTASASVVPPSLRSTPSAWARSALWSRA